MTDFYDHIGNCISIKNSPNKIISLVPSITELLFDLGLDENIAGITKYCVHPQDKIKNHTIIGGTDNPDIELIYKINPDLIIASKEENNETIVRALMNDFNVFVTDIHNFNDAIGFIYDIGQITDKIDIANLIIKEINDNFSTLKPKLFPKRAIYLIWKNPYMTINKNTFINNMLEYAGFQNLSGYKNITYPVISIDEIIEQNPEYLLLSSEPYPFSEKDKEELKYYLPETEILIVDGEFFSWYGSRMKYAPAYFNQLL
ncbi:MAG: helical backbone metal receptor [Marinilabiliales bacterium]